MDPHLTIFALSLAAVVLLSYRREGFVAEPGSRRVIDPKSLPKRWPQGKPRIPRVADPKTSEV